MKSATKHIIDGWLRCNYEPADDVNQMVEKKKLFDKINKYLDDLDRQPVSECQLGILVKKVFENVLDRRLGGTSHRVTYYGNLREKQPLTDDELDANESVVS